MAAGDYAIAYPGSEIHFHGVRMYREDPITVEKASDAAKNLKASNNEAAMRLARNCSERFFFRFITLRNEFADYRRQDSRAVTETDCFLALIQQKLSAQGVGLVKKAEGRTKRYESLWQSINKSKRFARLVSGIIPVTDSQRGSILEWAEQYSEL